MLKFEDVAKALDPDIRVELYKVDCSGIVDRMIYNGTLKNLKVYPDAIMKIIPQRTSREIYLEMKVY